MPFPKPCPRPASRTWGIQGGKNGLGPPALWAGHPQNDCKAISGVARPKGVEGLGMAGMGETLGIPWITLAVRDWPSLTLAPDQWPLGGPQLPIIPRVQIPSLLPSLNVTTRRLHINDPLLKLPVVNNRGCKQRM
jgi:hypothetical protein